MSFPQPVQSLCSTPDLHNSSWVPEPNFRGTWNIFSLCLSTMVISVWSAVHMDIPVRRSSMMGGFMTNALWMVAALFCPELLLLISFNQRTNAKTVLKHASEFLSTRHQLAVKPTLLRSENLDYESQVS